MQLQDAVVAAQDTSDSFNDAVLSERDVFELAKQSEMRDLLNQLADGHIALYKAVRRRLARRLTCAQTIEAFEKAEPALARIRTS